jgi:hypothetical protein
LINIRLNKEAEHYILSVVAHLLIIAVIILFQWDYSGAPTGGFIQVASVGQNSGAPISKRASEVKKEKEPQKEENAETDKETEKNDKPNDGVSGSALSQSAGGSGGFLDGTADTSSLASVYAESTRNVSLRYPTGWKFLDQNVKSKLDGVTFWYGGGDINPPPYIHLEVVEKYLFNEKNYKYKSDQGHHVFYYNDPVELSGQVSQIIYVRTETGEDYTIKLIIQGWDAFTAFKPVFYGIIKTFRFGWSLF